MSKSKPTSGGRAKKNAETRLNRFIAATDREILADAGKVTAEIAHSHAESEFGKNRLVQDRLYVSDFDAEVKKLTAGQAGQKTKNDA